MDGARSTIVIVDDNIANLRIGKNALSAAYDVYTVLSAEKMFALLQKNKPQLVLLDVDMPVMDGYAAIRLLKSNPMTKDIPVIFLTGKSDERSELEGLSLGAIDYIAKPFSPPLLRKRIEVHLMLEAQKRMLEDQADTLELQAQALKNFNENLQNLVEEKTEKVITLQNAILQTVADLVESRDSTTGGHIARIQHGIGILANALRERGLYEEDMQGWALEQLVESSQLHDVGKIAISDVILNKPGKLDAEEFAEIKKHAQLGVRIIERIEALTPGSDFLWHAKVCSGSHHEKWDGTGYPQGLSGTDIPLQGRLMAVADVYDALVSRRPYKEALCHEDAVDIILAGRGTHFDPVLTDLFEDMSDCFRAVK